MEYEYVFRSRDTIISEEIKYFLDYLMKHYKNMMDKIIASDHHQFRIDDDDNNLYICFDVHTHKDTNIDKILDKLEICRDPSRTKYPRYFTSAGEGAGKRYLTANGKIYYNNQHSSQTIYINSSEIIANITILVDLLAYIVKLW